MAGISIVDGAFTGLRVVRRNPGAVIAWAILHLISVAGFTWLMLVKFHDLFAKLRALPPMQAHADPAAAQARLHELMPIFHQILPLYAYTIPIGLVLGSIFICAMNRAVLRPRDSGLGYLRLGLDEIRQLILLIALFVVQLVVEIVLFGVAYAAFVLAKTAMHTGAGSANAHLPMLIGAGVFLLGLTAFEVKMSLASAQTFATRQINVFGTWSLTNGQFLPMIATYILAFVLYLVVGLILLVVMAVVGMVTSGLGGMGHLDAAHMGSFHLGAFHMAGPHTMTVTANVPPNVFLPNGMPDWHALALFLTPAVVIRLVLNSLFIAILLPILLTPPAAIYKALTSEANRGSGGVLNMS
jgi:hypothetical protein